jgi:outer membrane protein, heavy metal efflux system
LMNFPIEVFWQRGRRVQAAEQAFELLGNSLIQNGLNVIRDARWAHTDLVLALGRQDVAQRSVELRDRIALLTEARLKAGDISELDAMAAKSDLAGAKEQLARLSAEVAVAKERFRFALGLALDPAAIPVKADPVSNASPPPASDLLEKAMASRADLKAAEISIAAATKRAGWERTRLSLVSAQLSSKGIGNNGILTSPGISAELPIFNRNQGLIARADADVEVQMRLYLALKQRVAFEVQEARQLLLQAQAGLTRLSVDVLPALQKTASLAQQQYEKGEVAYLFVLEQSRGLVDAELRLADSEAVVRRSIAQLERSVGSK